MTSTDSQATKIPEKDAAGTQLEPKRPAEVSNSLSNDISIPPLDSSSISINTNSKDSPRRGMEAPFPEAPGDVKGGSFVEELHENEGPQNELAIDFKEDAQVNIFNISSSSSGLKSVFTVVFWTGLWVSFTSLFKEDPAIKKAKEKKAEAKEILRIIRLSSEMATATAQELQINSPFQLSLIMKEMWMEGCPCTQKSRHWKGVIVFQEEYFRSKNSESFISFHTGLMKQLFTPLPRSITPDISSIHMRSSGSYRNAKSPKSQPNAAPIFNQKKLKILPVAETLPPATIHVPTQNNGTEQPLTLPVVPECEESNEKDVFITKNEDPKVDKVSKEKFNVANTPLATMSAREPNNNEVDATKELLNNQLFKL